MSVFAKMNKTKTQMFIGGYGSGKTTKAIEYAGDNHVKVYADELDESYMSLPSDTSLIVEEVSNCSDVNVLLDLMRTRDNVVLTSLNKKDVSKKIVDMCKVTPLGQTNYWYQEILEIAPRAEESISDDKQVIDLVGRWLKEKDRDKVASMLLKHRPPETQFMTWLSENMMNERIAYVDGIVKWKWKKEYFYEMMAYTHMGGNYLKFKAPKRASYSDYPNMARRLGLKRKETGLMLDLLCDNDFKEWAKTKLDNKQCRTLGLGEKRKRRKNSLVVLDNKSKLDYWL